MGQALQQTKLPSKKIFSSSCIKLRRSLGSDVCHLRANTCIYFFLHRPPNSLSPFFNDIHARSKVCSLESTVRNFSFTVQAIQAMDADLVHALSALGIRGIRWARLDKTCCPASSCRAVTVMGFKRWDGRALPAHCRARKLMRA
jgi:hypothetical protein